jgi:hypothetical protein
MVYHLLTVNNKWSKIMVDPIKSQIISQARGSDLNQQTNTLNTSIARLPASEPAPPAKL